eukprot:CAMPEP_0119341994 /NCGR_PEP_ID=MMETSP1333-20130426/103768_1 /TAXON_ID=418940 /ORGANISM="Scyphosphaera apsteinii, Strain RCC1455" /LENGTH=474 /DNA_ID=CAMNT_0007354111 /DNA_START=257 /DNA_END=1678 /DNA_ORIENTATION=-
MQLTAVQRLWDENFCAVPSVSCPRRATPHLPDCARNLKVYVYDLPSTYHANLLEKMERRRGKSSCDYERSACAEIVRSRPRADNWDYSNLRQYAAEVPILYKFMQMPQTGPEQADLFVVPWFASTELSGFEYTPWYPRNEKCVARFEALLSNLTHFAQNPSRHVFLSSRDWTFSLLRLRQLAKSSGALLFNYGPRTAPNEILIAPSSAGFGLPLPHLTYPAKFFLFAMMDISINPIRRDIDSELRRLNATHPELSILYHPIIDHRSIPLPPLRALELMSQTLLCPIIQGDLPYQHRLFDALVAGCVPLFLRYQLDDVDDQPMKQPCEAWSWDAKNRSAMKGVARATLPRTICKEQHLPYWSTVDWHALTMRIDVSALSEGRLAEAIAALEISEIVRKRRKLERMRHHFIYERDNASPDAFSAMMVEVCNALRDPCVGGVHVRGKPACKSERATKDSRGSPVTMEAHGGAMRRAR